MVRTTHPIGVGSYIPIILAIYTDTINRIATQIVLYYYRL